MRCNSFSGTLIFAALAAAGLPAAWLGLGTLLGVGAALSLYFVGLGVAYASAIAPNAGSALRIGALGAALGGVVLCLAPTPGMAAAGAAGIVALARSGLLYRSEGLRALAFEIVLSVGGVAVAIHLADGGIASISLAVWSYFLIQSLYFTLGGIRERPRDGSAAGDAFDVAQSRLSNLLEEDGT
jgi:hypothetical protein